MERDEIVRFLRGVPAEVDDILRDLTDEQLLARPGPVQWSLLEIACHLRDSAIEEGLRARRMVEEDNPALEPYDEQARAAEREYQREEPPKVMTALRAYWTGYAYQLERITGEEWERSGVHPEVGRVSVRLRAEAEVEHVQAHLDQMRAARAAVAED